MTVAKILRMRNVFFRALKIRGQNKLLSIPKRYENILNRKFNRHYLFSHQF